MKKYVLNFLFCCLLILPLMTVNCQTEKKNSVSHLREETIGFQSRFPGGTTRTWIGPDYWANRLQDWQIRNGRLECLETRQRKPMRTVHLLTRRIAERQGDFRTSVMTGVIDPSTPPSPNAATGFLTGAGADMDYRAAALIHSSPGEGAGLFAGINGEGKLFFRDFTEENKFIAIQETPSVFPERHCGPILSSGYTLSQNILKLTAQFLPLGKNDSKDVYFQIKKDTQWQTISSSRIIEPGFTAPFKINGWDSSQNIDYRVVYTLKTAQHILKEYYWEGTIRHDPIKKEEMVVAAFTGNHNVSKPGVERGTFLWNTDVWFPHLDIVQHVKSQKPDFLFFSGDQVYEGASPTSADLSKPYLDYLYKWYLWCWAFRDLTRDIPSVVIPDDHDVFHGNVWGENGKATDEGLSGANAQDSGGYKLPSEFVNMVQRTQTSHLPDPFDPAKVKQGIGVYYCSILYGGISFAVIEDRKFKSAPKRFLPEARVRNAGGRHGLQRLAAGRSGQGYKSHQEGICRSSFRRSTSGEYNPIRNG